jgi:hypothetical protein
MCEYVMILSCIDASCCIQKKQTAPKSANEGAKKNNKGVDKGGRKKKKGTKQPPATAKEDTKKASGSRTKVCA